MNKIITAAFAVLILTFCAFGQNGKAVSFEKFDSYFENNNAGLTGDPSYLAFTDETGFNKIFGAAAVMSTNSFLPDGAFKTKLVVATIKRGPFREYSDVKVTSKGGKLMVWYKTNDRKAESATYASPLILAVKKGKYKEVVFMENGKKAGSVPLKK